MTVRTVTLQRDASVQIGGATVRLVGVQVGGGQDVAAVLAVDEPAAAPAAPDASAGPGFRRRYRRPAGCTPAREAEALRVAAYWSAKIARITVLNQARFAAIHGRLEDGYTVGDLEGAVAAYADDDWHRKHAVWLDIADFFKPQKTDPWIRRAGELREQAAAKARQKARIGPAAQTLITGVAQAAQVASEREELLAAFGALDAAGQQDLIKQAVTELLKLQIYRGRRQPLTPSMDCPPVKMQVLAILSARRAAAGKESSRGPQTG